MQSWFRDGLEQTIIKEDWKMPFWFKEHFENTKKMLTQFVKILKLSYWGLRQPLKSKGCSEGTDLRNVNLF